MLSTTLPPKTAARAPRRAARAVEPPPHIAALARLGDAAALIDRRSHHITWRSDAWSALLPAGDDEALLQTQLRGLTAALGAGGDSDAPRRLDLGDKGQWAGELVVLDAQSWLLRLTDRREQSRALQRQLDDREQLLFTSRVFSVGEMATTLAHELNQPIGATANLLRGLRSRLARRKTALDGEEAAALERALEQVMFAARVITR